MRVTLEEVALVPMPKLDPGDQTTSVTFKLPTRLEDKLRDRADTEDRNVSAILRDALLHYLERTSPAA